MAHLSSVFDEGYCNDRHAAEVVVSSGIVPVAAKVRVDATVIRQWMRVDLWVVLVRLHGFLVCVVISGYLRVFNINA